MSAVNFSDFQKCAGGICRGKLCRKLVRTPKIGSNKKILCRECWKAKAVKAAESRYHWTHVAYSGGNHEMFYFDDLEAFIQEYEIEAKESE